MARLLLSFWLLCLCNATGVVCQTPSDLTTSVEYKRIGNLIRQRSYGPAITETQALIARAPEFEHAYEKLDQAAAASEKQAEANAWLESQLRQSRPNYSAYFGLALISESKKNYTSAIEHYKLYLRNVPHSELASVNLVRASTRAGQLPEAEKYLKAQLAKHPENPALHIGLGYYFIRVRKSEEAIREFDLALSLNPRTTDAYYYKLLTILNDQKTTRLIELVEQYRPAFEADPDKERQRGNLAFIGSIYRDVGNHIEALNCLERAQNLAVESGNLSAERNYTSQLAALWSRQDNYQQALMQLRRSIELAEEQKADAGRQWGDVGWIQFLVGDLSGAMESYDKALALSLKSGDRTNQSRILMNVGKVLVAEDKPDQAIVKYEQALTIANADSNRALQFECLNALGFSYVRTENYEKALAALQLALKLSREDVSPLPEATALNSLGELHLRQNKLQPALDSFEQARRIATSINNPRNVWRALAGLAATYEQLGQLEQAQTNNRLAIEAMDSVRATLIGEEEKAGFLQDKIAIYKRQIALLVAAGKPGYSEVFHYAERARARAFLDLLAEAKISVEQNIDREQLKRYEELQQQVSQLTSQLLKERAQETNKQDKAKLAELEKGLAQADVKLGAWLRDLRQRNPRYAALKYPEPIELVKLQQMLDDKTVLLSYSLSEPASFLLAVTRTDFQIKRLPSESTLRLRVQSLVKSITDKNQPDAAGYRRDATLLSRDLLQPIQQMLAGKKELIIVPDGALHRLPFQALFSPGMTTRGDLRQLPYLIKRFSISYAPSASVLAELKNERGTTSTKGFIGFGDPTYDADPDSAVTSMLRSPNGERLNYQRLPFSRTEVQGIAQLFPDADQLTFLGAAANEENTRGSRLSQFRYVHFSTHSYINEARPRLSSLVLSLATNNPKSDDGLLSAYEIFGLKLNADLVVLSACDTGLGKEIKGEGLISLTRAFMYAGTPSVVVSLWNLNDESAADLMIRFYSHLKKDGMSKSEALRQAQLQTIQDNGFPFFWAPFVLVGKP